MYADEHVLHNPYEKAKVGDVFLKESKNAFIVFNNNQMPLLSKDPKKWFYNE